MKSNNLAKLFAAKYKRIKILTSSALYIKKKSGFFALTKHLISFLLGNRQNLIVPVKNIATSVDPAKQYLNWIQKNENPQTISPDELIYQPKISLITPTFNTSIKYLTELFDSVLNQIYQNWEFCVVDGGSTNVETLNFLEGVSKSDDRIKIKFLKENLGISENTNEALKLATGEFIGLLDHDDLLAPNSLYEIAALLNKHPEADMIYSDEDKLDLNGNRCFPFFKPKWSPDLMTSMMFTCHLGVYRKTVVDKIGGFRSQFDGAQDYDFVLRFISETSNIFHIPKILYHWRITKGSTASSLSEKGFARQAQINAVKEYFNNFDDEVEVTEGLAENLVRVKRIISQKPLVSIIIPTHDKVNLLQNCVDSILKKTKYENFEILILNNNSKEKETFEYFDKIVGLPRVKIIDYPKPFNFSAINNFAVNQTEGEILLFLNNDTEVINDEWLESMVEHINRKEVGIVGARLLYPDDTIQHAGVILGIGGVAGHSHKYFHKNHPGYFSRSLAIQNLSAVTGACLMIRKDLFNELGGFNEENLAIAFNDVDLCLRVRQKNLLIVYTPYAQLYHHESVSRGSEDSPEKVKRFNNEINFMLETWGELLNNDPYYSPNLTLELEDFSIRI